VADRLVTPQELAAFLGLTWADLTAIQQANLSLIVEVATAKVQSAAGQRLIDVTDTITLDVDLCEYGPWLALPQLPVRSVASVLIDGVAATDWYLRRQQLWRLNGWNVNASAPTQVTVTSTHGHLDGAQALEFGRGIVFGLAAGASSNPTGAASEQIDDYRITYADAESRMHVTDGTRDLLRAEYGVNTYVTGSM
jgi:hypothetical protein